MLNALAAAIIVGHAQVGPTTCQLDVLMPVGAGEWKLVTEVNSCQVTTEIIRYLK